MVRPVKNIVIVGGGTAGWLTAGVIAAKHRARQAGGFTVTLVESPTTPIIGVGEGTWPTLRTTLAKIGVSETDFFRECDAAFKQGAKFARWTTGAPDDAYYHPLVLPQSFGQVNLAAHWLASGAAQSFCDAVCPQGVLCDDGLAPKTITAPPYQGAANYAYHLDAGKFAPFLQRHCCEKLGVRHVLADVRNVTLTEDGDIQGVVTEQCGEVRGDLFVDCTGFRSLLLGEALGVKFRECGDVLFCDTALAIQVPHEREDSPLSTHTISTAQSAGWIWDIGLPTRRGVGHVYSSRHISDEDAERELRGYIGPAARDLSARKISIRSGHRETFWKGNCVAVGLAAGFLEPLEASAIVLIELSAKLIAEQMPACREVMDVVAARFNATTHYRWGRIIDFLKLHYVLSQRSDTAFWRDNRAPETIPERLSDLLRLWRHQPPWLHEEFDRVEEVFPAASYQYVLYGMGFRTEIEPGALADEAALAQRALRENALQTERLRASLPRHRDLIRKIVEHGLQPV
ncbi:MULTISPECIES: tryptophan halogenase family protein [unclassified Caulobacter]|uniref:tryptophan halogenase family protein n=1 Tax=unclassified Caulobacter TaxID=2648921 RepID=UPI0006FF7538|nr:MULTISPECIES: tryptophan halogenase family protein [unclassified Caulobacter]KQV58475.1 tryptophan halogenase [Caulobacter sp. Root342]KQV69016.1 tryptophan halogenase [Caulobacter sp. Root343]